MARLLRIAAAVALGGLATAGLTACTGGGSDASPSPTPVVTVTEDTPPPSPTPTLTPEEELLAQIPEDARGESFPEAINFSRFFLELYPRLFDIGADAATFRYLSGEECGFCANALANSDETHAHGGYSVGLVFSYDNDTIQGGRQDDGYWFISYEFEATASITYGPDGQVLDESPSESGLVKFRLGRRDDHWYTDTIDFDLQ